MIVKFKNVLVLAPHRDDGEFGCGGTIAKLIENGANVFYAAFSIADKSSGKNFSKEMLKEELRKACAVLGISSDRLLIFNYEVRKLNYVRQEILDELIGLRKKIKFDLILMPSLNDIHQDHAVVAKEGLRAFKDNTILSYELVWNNLTFNTQLFVKLDKRLIQKKVKAISKYKSQGSRHYMSGEFILSLAKARGTQVGLEYAETFEVVRWLIE